MSDHQLTLQIEGLRSRMIRTAESIGSLNHPQVIALSQELDQLLVTMQRLKIQNRPPCGIQLQPCQSLTEHFRY